MKNSKKMGFILCIYDGLCTKVKSSQGRSQVIPKLQNIPGRWRCEKFWYMSHVRFSTIKNVKDGNNAFLSLRAHQLAPLSMTKDNWENIIVNIIFSARTFKAHRPEKIYGIVHIPKY